MHEASIAISILKTSETHCVQHGCQRIKNIFVQLGRASGVLKEALMFAFDAMKEETIAAEAQLIIQEIPLSGRCRTCRRRFTVDEVYVLSCPLCGSFEYTVDTGRELNLTELEFE